MTQVVAEAGARPLVLHSDVREPLSALSFLDRALVFAELSMISYNDENEARAAAEAIGFSDAELFDLVTRVPPRWMGYQHGGEEVYLDRNGRIRRLTGMRRAHDRWQGFLRGLRSRRLDPLSDHSIHGYIAHLAGAAREEAVAVQRGAGAAVAADLTIVHPEGEPTA